MAILVRIDIALRYLESVQMYLEQIISVNDSSGATLRSALHDVKAAQVTLSDIEAPRDRIIAALEQARLDNVWELAWGEVEDIADIVLAVVEKDKE